MIGAGAFEYGEFTKITLPKSIKTIGTYAFAETQQVKEIKLPSGVKTIEEAAFLSSSITKMVLPSSVTKVGRKAFSGSNVKSFTFSKNMTEIPDAIFWATDSLTTVTFPKNSKIKTIGSGAFQYCESLKNITIPKSVRTIKDSAFHSCGSLKTEIGRAHV